MRTTWIVSITLLSLGGATISCHRSSENNASTTPLPNPSAVAVVAGQEISEERLLAELRRRFGARPAEGVTAEQKLETLERLVRQEAIYAQAKISGFDQSPEIQARIKNLVVAQFTEKRLTNSAPVVTEQELLAAYEASGSRFVQPEAVRGAVIFVEAPRVVTSEKRAELRQRAEAVLEEARRATDDRAFAQVVARHSEDQATRYRGGDIGWLGAGRAGYDPALAEALLKLSRLGELAPLVETARGFYVAKLIEKREAARKPMAEVREALRYQISRQKAEQADRAFHAAMKSGLDIQINRALLDSISFTAPPTEPPAAPGTTTAGLQ